MVRKEFRASPLAEENYFCTDALAMEHVLAERGGRIYWAGRFLMLIFQWKWVGAVLLSLWLTVSAWCIDRMLPRFFTGTGFLLPSLLLCWVAGRGYNIYMRTDPSAWLVTVLGWTLFVGIIALLLAAFVKKNKSSRESFPYGIIVMILAVVAPSAYAWTCRQNVILSCDMQNRMLDEDWQGMIADG